MARMMAGMGTANRDIPPEQRYRTQLEQLAAMGFCNHEANLQGVYLKLNIIICTV